jgi:Flp pilus assembly protein TadD
LLLAAIGTAIAAGARRALRLGGDGRAATAALLGALAGYLVGAGIDWMWELTVVSIVGLAIVGLLTGPATIPKTETSSSGPRTASPSRPSRGNHRMTLGLRAVLGAACFAVVIAQAIPLLAQARIRESEEAVARGNGNDALESARAARAVQPWAASPHLQLALVEERTGDLRSARRAIDDAIERDPTDWRLRLVSARLEARSGRIRAAKRSLERAKRLNPRSRLFGGR